MKKLRIRRRAVSTMIGGIIVLGLFLTALAAMILLTQQYDAYQQTVDNMKQADMNRFSENLGVVPPGLIKYPANPRNIPSTPCSSGCNMYTMTINDFASNSSLDIGVQIARVYINSSRLFSQSGCVNLCVLEPSATPSPFSFNASQRFINPGEFQHNVNLWLPSSIKLPDSDTLGNPAFALNTVSMITTRGRQFSFQWPVPPAGIAAGSVGGASGGTGLYIGPLVITFQKALITYTRHSGCNPTCTLSDPIGGTNGYWVIPPSTASDPFIIYVKIQTDKGVLADVYLTAQTVLELAQFNSPGNVIQFFVVAPITPTFCAKFAQQDPTIVCDPSYGYYGGGNTGDPGTVGTPSLVAYSACSSTPYSGCPNRYRIPKPTTQQLLDNQKGNPVVVVFAATLASGNIPNGGGGGFNPGQFATSFLGLTYVWDDQTGLGDYTYAVTLPFMAICFDNANSNGSSSPCGI